MREKLIEIALGGTVYQAEAIDAVDNILAELRCDKCLYWERSANYNLTYKEYGYCALRKDHWKNYEFCSDWKVK